MLTIRRNDLISDHYGDWSATFAGTIAPVSPEPAKTPPAPSAALVCASPRIAHRALQTLRQTRMQMCSGAGPRAQVLPLHQSAGRNARYGLCPTGCSRYGRSIPGELSFRARDSRPDMQHQSRTSPSQGTSIDKQRVYRKTFTLGCSSDRPPPGGHPHRQHARDIAPAKALTQSWRNQG